MLTDGPKAAAVKEIFALSPPFCPTALLTATQTDYGRIKAELVIRDYGTHVITKAKVGAIVEKQDFIDQNSVHSNETTLEEFKAAAAVSFIGHFSASAAASISKQVSEETIKRLSRSTKHSQLNTIGGPSVNRILADDNSSHQVRLPLWAEQKLRDEYWGGEH